MDRKEAARDTIKEIREFGLAIAIMALLFGVVGMIIPEIGVWITVRSIFWGACLVAIPVLAIAFVADFVTSFRYRHLLG